MEDDDILEEAQETDEESATEEAQAETESEDEEVTTSEEGDEESEAKAEDDPEPPRKRGKSAARRIGQLTAKARELERQLEEATKPKKAPLVAPDKDTFEDYEEYIVAQASYLARKALEDERLAEEKYAAQRQKVERTRKFQERLDPARDKYDDFDEVAFSENVPISEAMSEAIEASDDPGELAYYLGTHPEKAAEIANMASPGAQARALGVLEAKISAPKIKRVSNAPAPIQSRKGTAAKSADDMSVEELLESMGQPH